MNIFVKNWREVAIKHYSTLALYAVCLMIVIPEVLFRFFGMDLNPIILGRWTLGAAVFGLAGRFVVQTESHKWKRRIAIGAAVLMLALLSAPAMAGEDDAPRFEDAAFELISKWEGKRNHSYQDIVGVWTICYGHTATAAPGQYKGDAVCRYLLIKEIAEYRAGLSRYFTHETHRYRLPAAREAAYVSLAYNVGVGGAGRSTAVRRLNRGDIAGGCEALTWWNKAGGRVVRGLVRRRNAEQVYCLRGL